MDANYLMYMYIYCKCKHDSEFKQREARGGGGHNLGVMTVTSKNNAMCLFLIKLRGGVDPFLYNDKLLSHGPFPVT